LKILIVDNYDSFTHNLYHYAAQFADEVRVVKNTKIRISQVDMYDKIILSPGTGLPKEHQNLKELITEYAATKSILGVCLGHQAIAESFGAKLKNLNDVMHGVSTEINFVKKDIIFQNIPNKIRVGHYHSWVIDEPTLPDCFEITSQNEVGLIMSVKHKTMDVKGVQFHPESIMTEYGLLMIKNWVFS
tara:strand:- start:273 stop:836 length:564 start_codon:yes stop_codon:yes gene_type:complete